MTVTVSRDIATSQPLSVNRSQIPLRSLDIAPSAAQPAQNPSQMPAGTVRYMPDAASAAEQYARASTRAMPTSLDLPAPRQTSASIMVVAPDSSTAFVGLDAPNPTARMAIDRYQQLARQDEKAQLQQMFNVDLYA
jgi:hypothetical protein